MLWRAFVKLVTMQVEEGGIVFFRESCFRQSGDKARKSNPTHYRCALRRPCIRLNACSSAEYY